MVERDLENRTEEEEETLPLTARFDYNAVVAGSSAEAEESESESGYPVHGFRHAVINIGVTGLKRERGYGGSVAFRVP